MTENKTPTSSPQPSSIDDILELQWMQKVFSQIEAETSEIAEKIFEYLFDINDLALINGEIPLPSDSEIRIYIEALNKLFQFSRRKREQAAFRIINRKMVKELDKKTYLFCMCVDGGISLDILCEVVNQENMARTPGVSPVKITIKPVIANQQQIDLAK